MRWQRGHRSSDVEDQRGMRRGPLRPGGLRLGLGGIVALGLLSVLTGENFFALLAPPEGAVAPTQQSSAAPSAAEQELVEFVSFVLDDVQGVWRTAYPRLAGRAYENARLVLFTDSVTSGCGQAEAAMGPFYCPADNKAYIDLGFYHELRQRFGAPGDFAQAYVLAHEIGHHVQTLLGVSETVRALQARAPREAGLIQVRMELQADCFAGVWAKSTAARGLLEPGDIDEAQGAAAAVGDDRIQRQATGRVNPESWTHGSSQQRMAWFMQGYTSGDAASCDTFKSRLAADDHS